MVTIDNWDWKTNLGMLKNINTDIKSKVSTYLKGTEKDCYNKMISYYEDRISLFSIFNQLLEKTYQNWEETDMFPIPILCERLLPINPKLYRYALSQYNKVLEANPSLTTEITTLYNTAIDKCRADYLDGNLEIFKMQIGAEYLGKIMPNLNVPFKVESRTNKSVSSAELRDVVSASIDDIITDKKIVKRFGNSLVKNYDIQIKSGVGFAEWWDRDLLKSNRDLLVLYDNEDLRNVDDLRYTLYHEVYPGHGQFYTFLRENKDSIKFFDQGATLLIEGWATYCEWFTKSGKYSQDLFNRAKRFLFIALNPNYTLDDKISTIYSEYLNYGYSYEQALNVIVSFSQYPTFLESYYLGAFCITEILDNKSLSPKEFLHSFIGQSCNDLFALTRR